MSIGRLTVEDMASLLGKAADDPTAQEMIDEDVPASGKDDFYSFVSSKEHGFDIVFNLGKMTKRISNPIPEKLYIVAFHLYYANMIDFSGQKTTYATYSCPLPGHIAFGDTRRRIDEILGKPLREGGGNYVELLKSRVAIWARYCVDDLELYLQFDDATRLQRITLGGY